LRDLGDRGMLDVADRTRTAALAVRRGGALSEIDDEAPVLVELLRLSLSFE
jgi:hypothetical protein